MLYEVITQFLGWSSIIYMAVLSSADQEQYEASMVDGANKLQQIFHITIPLLLPTIAINLIISLGNILSVGFEKVLLMYQPSIYDTADVIQTYSFRIGLQGGNFSYGTAVGFVITSYSIHYTKLYELPAKEKLKGLC